MKILIKNINAVLPCEKGFEVRGCSIGTENDIISFVGDIPEGYEADRIIDGTGRLAIPGLINSHTHVYMTVFRNCADDLLFGDWLFGRISPLEDKLTEEDCYWGTLLGFMEMLKTGTTCFNDMYIFTRAAARACIETGMRGVLSRGLVGGRSDEAGGIRRLNEQTAEMKEFAGIDNITFRLAPHAPYTCDDKYMTEVGELARELGVGIHTHLAESRSEIQTIRENYGCTPTELMDRCGILTENTVAAHCVQLTDGDIEILAKRGVSVATNPISNLKLANGFAPIPKLLKAGVNVCLGTDGAASNNTLNMFRDLSFLTLLHKGVNEDPLAVSASEGFACATVNGAKALGINAGVLAPGKKADISILNMEGANMQPVNNAIAALSYSASGYETETVLVNGKILLDNGEYTTIDAEKVKYNVKKICDRIGTKVC